MSEAIRFLHAGPCWLDSAMTGVATTPAAVRPRLEDASLVAFDRLVESAIDRRVDFVLLGGETFCYADRSLRARLRIESGLARLAEAGIATVACAGTIDPASGWLDLALPEEVTILTDRDAEATLEIAGQTVTIARLAEALHPPRRCDLAIGLIPAGSDLSDDLDETADFDYLGLGESQRSETELGRGWIHDPGPLVPGSPDQTETCGATLVERDRGGRLRLTPLALSPVVCHEITLHIDADADIESLAETMAAAAPRVHGDDSVAVVTWSIEGQGPVRGDLALDGTWDDLIELVDAGQSVHRLRLEPAAGDADDVSEMLAGEIETYLDEQTPDAETLIDAVAHRELRERMADAVADGRVADRTRTLATMAVAADCPALWNDAA